MEKYLDWEGYTEGVLRTAGPSESRDRFIMGAMGLAGEAGELVDLLKKVSFHGKPFDRELFIKEAGDVLWYYALLLHTANVSLDVVMSTNLAKLRARYPDGFSVEASAARADVDQDPTPVHG